MSTLLKKQKMTKVIYSFEDLRGYFQMYSKTPERQQIGIECEVFGVFKETGRALPYSGESGIERILRELAYEFGYEQIMEEDHVIALKKEETVISLEPGGQVELSASPVSSVHETKAQLDEFFFQLKTIASFVGGIAFITSGIHPFSRLNEIEWIPKRRYQIMSKYLGLRGMRAHDMMKRTCTNQINLDYTSEENAIEKMRLAFRITPIAAAMFANSGFAHGKPTGFLAERLNIWRFTDPERSGLALNLACEHCKFEDYLDYVLDLPVMFFVRDNEWIVPVNLTFRRFIDKGYQGILPTQSDFELHLSTIFTDVRFKQYFEIRGIDCQRIHLMPAVFAFWKGILYDEETRRAAKKLVHSWKDRQLLKLHQDVEKMGMHAKIQGTSVYELANQLVKLSGEGLKRQKKLDSSGFDERVYLIPLIEEILKNHKTPAEQLNQLWKGPMRQNPKALVDYLTI